MARRALCIHAHFYQPSREDPLTGVIPLECGAEPYANWNEKINANCYLPNAQLGNFEKISFNLGPTLTKWMEGNARETLALIRASEQKSRAQWQVDNALAQSYHHTILPLATRLDKVTQVRWGIANYVHTFGAFPQGMWLPETAVDLETLSVLAENGIRFTILAPWQAAQPVDVTQPYRVELPGGKSICVFFYHSGLSTCVSFDANATTNGDSFIRNCLLPSYQPNEEDQLLLLASDGELYGHHQPFRDKFLQYLLNGALHQADIEYTTPGRWLIDHPPRQTVQIREGTSWSCDEGLQRWRGECGCTPHGGWKRPLREFMDAVAQQVDKQYIQVAGDWLRDPWQTRDEFIHVLLGERPYVEWEREQVFHPLRAEESQALHQLLLAQVDRQRMYTSCGWFFEDFDRIEPRNNVRYAANALVLTEAACGEPVIPEVRPLLRHIFSWRSPITAEEEFDYSLRRLAEMA